MSTSSENAASPRWKWIAAIPKWIGKAVRVWIVFLFLLLLPLGLLSDSMAMACRNDSYEGHKKLRYCNISLATRIWLDFLPLMLARSAAIHLERGIALSQIGREEEALTAFERAIEAARAKPGPWEQELQSRIQEFDARQPTILWNSLLTDGE
ncbi:tetratricopeptide repeat protein [Ruegeria sp. 2205SS24-7]|uniref:tetratricopeptide repeat protein n=1 Tax=Ruegeria discodermiae TaxID=3064389 RepID=UPI002741791E|nr:tetratricopeptide repeat protein [Ruegeria sp. 2205SS24-7]MDP5216018.1 tetratricopeptide repeat protein [Ruegeria sp. 2205SS24-7]